MRIFSILTLRLTTPRDHLPTPYPTALDSLVNSSVSRSPPAVNIPPAPASSAGNVINTPLKSRPVAPTQTTGSPTRPRASPTPRRQKSDQEHFLTEVDHLSLRDGPQRSAITLSFANSGVNDSKILESSKRIMETGQAL